MVSVIIPTYNREKTIEKSINSVLNQTYSDIEVIVVDDGSNDNTVDIINNINDSRIKVLETEHLGACHARNVGINNANGDYIAFQDSDDIWLKNKLQTQLDALIKYDADIVFCMLNKIKDNNIIAIWPEKIEEGFISRNSSLLGIGTQTLVCKKKVISELLFDENMPRFQELEMLIRANKKGAKIYCVNKGLVDYFVGDDSISSNVEKRVNAYELLIDKHPDLKRISPKMCEVISNSLLLTYHFQKLNNKACCSRTIKLAYKYNMTFRLKAKRVIIDMGIYTFLQK